MAFVSDTRQINTTAPITGGQNLQSDLTLALPQASGAASGYLSSVDWTTFNNKQAALGFTPQDVANLVQNFTSPQASQYPSTLLVSNTLANYLTSSVAAATYAPLTRLINGQPLSANVTLGPTDIGIGNVTNDAQTKAAIVPNTVPTTGQILVGDGSKYNPVAMSGAATINNLGVVSITFPNAAVGVSGVTQLSVAPAVPSVPIAFGANDPAVELTANKATGMGTPDNTKYPTTLLLSSQLALKVTLGAALTPATNTKITFDAQGLITAGANATTADIADSVDKRYVTDIQRTNLQSLSGRNTGDQDLSPFALRTDLTATNTSVANLSASLSNFALSSDLSNTNASVSSLSSSVANTNEVKLTFGTGLTRIGNTVTSDAMNTSITPHKFLGNVLGISANAAFVQPSTADLTDGVTGTGNIVLKTSASLVTPSIAGPLPIITSDTNNTGVTSSLLVSHDLTSGTAAIGLGTAIDLQGQSNTTPDRLMGRIQAVWTNASDASRSASLQFNTVSSGVLNVTVPLTIFSSGGVSVGGGSDPGAGNLNINNGLMLSGGAALGNFLRGTGSVFQGSAIQPSDVHKIGLTEHKLSRTVTVDQTVTTETVHMAFTVPGSDAVIGHVFRIWAYGTIDNGTTSIIFNPRIRWGGVAGTVLIAGPVITGTTTAQTNSTWKIDAIVQIAGVGASGAAQTEACLYDHTTLTTGALTVQETNSGSTATTINTLTSNDLVLTWSLSATTGAPHVRTFGGFIEQLT